VNDKKSWQSGLHDASPYLTIGIQLAATMVFYIGVGYLIDRWKQTEPTFLIVGGIVGMIAFFIQLIRVVKRLSSTGSGAAKWSDKDPKSTS